MTFCANSLIMA